MILLPYRHTAGRHDAIGARSRTSQRCRNFGRDIGNMTVLRHLKAKRLNLMRQYKPVTVENLPRLELILTGITQLIASGEYCHTQGAVDRYRADTDRGEQANILWPHTLPPLHQAVTRSNVVTSAPDMLPCSHRWQAHVSGGRLCVLLRDDGICPRGDFGTGKDTCCRSGRQSQRRLTRRDTLAHWQQTGDVSAADGVTVHSAVIGRRHRAGRKNRFGDISIERHFEPHWLRIGNSVDRIEDDLERVRQRG